MASVVQSVVRAFAVLRTSTAQLIAVVDPYLAELIDCYGEDARTRGARCCSPHRVISTNPVQVQN